MAHACIKSDTFTHFDRISRWNKFPAHILENIVLGFK